MNIAKVLARPVPGCGFHLPFDPAVSLVPLLEVRPVGTNVIISWPG